MPHKNETQKIKSVDIEITTIQQLNEQWVKERQTIVHCSYVSKRKYINGGWINIHPNTYLVHSADKLQLLHAENIPLAPAIHVFTRVGEPLQFTLIFPAIPKDWKSFSLVEKCNSSNGFIIHDIQRNNVGLYEVLID